MMNVLASEEEIEMLLQQVDPFNNQRMTYSEVVLVLSSHMVPKDPVNPCPQVALLEKFIQDSESMGEADGLRIGQGANEEESGFDFADDQQQQPNQEYNGEPYTDANQVENSDSLAV